jgi:hypothetical protein
LLLNPSATTLNHNSQHDYKEQTGNNPDDHGTVHIDPTFFLLVE